MPSLSSEITPFLADDRSDTSNDDDLEDHQGVAGSFDSSKGRPSRDLIGLFCAFLIIQMGLEMAIIPLGRIIESAVCYEYWKQHDPDRIPVSGKIPEATCKTNAVQASFATVQGYWVVLNALSSQERRPSYYFKSRKLTSIQAQCFLFRMGCWPNRLDAGL